MNTTKCASDDIKKPGGGTNLPCIGLTPDAIPEVQKPFLAENSQTGVSTRNALPGKAFSREKEQTRDSCHWYALRTTYGREKKASDYLNGKGVLVFCPTLSVVKIVNKKRQTFEESRIPNIFFAYGTEEEIKSFVYDNVNLPYLRFYYRHFHEGIKIQKEPLIVPDNQIESLRIICAVEAQDVLLVPDNVKKFKTGQRVRIIKGDFKGVVGQVARFCGQQRVAIVIDGAFTIATAYIPNAFLSPLD